MMYTRVLVELNVSKGFPEELFFSNKNEELIAQLVHYEWIPIWCTKCSRFGHNLIDCRMAKPYPPKLQLERKFKRPYQAEIVPQQPNSIDTDIPQALHPVTFPPSSQTEIASQLVSSKALGDGTSTQQVISKVNLGCLNSFAVLDVLPSDLND